MKQNFKEFLTESQHKTEISDSEAIKLIKTQCRDAFQNAPTRPIIRGMHDGKTSFIIHGENSERKSANTSNYYTVIFDHVLSKSGYPKRSKSIICGNWKNLAYAGGFGSLYAILPYDGVKIGVCPEYDMWRTVIKTGLTGVGNDVEYDVNEFNDILENARVPQTSFIDIVNHIEELLNKGADKLNYSENRLISFFNKGEVKEQLEKAYSEDMGFSLHTTETVYSLEKRRELWISGKCIAVPLTFYEQRDWWLHFDKEE